MNSERIVVICAILLSQIYSRTCSSYPRESPIAIFSNYAERVNRPILQLGHSESDRLLLNNTGYQLLVTLNQVKPSSIMTGGTLFNEKYTFNRIEFIWNGYWGASCGHTIDGRGAPLEVASIYTNVKYKTFENCLSHSDGLAILVIPVLVEGHLDNHLFNPLKKTIQKLIYPNNKPIRTIGGGPLLEAFFLFDDISTYYSYPGSYINVRTNTFSHCATIILVPDYARPLISIDQFQNSFLLLQSVNGSPLTRPLAVFDAGNRPVLQANGTITKITP